MYQVLAPITPRGERQIWTLRALQSIVDATLCASCAVVLMITAAVIVVNSSLAVNSPGRTWFLCTLLSVFEWLLSLRRTSPAFSACPT